jgi:hypothetical protein
MDVPLSGILCPVGRQKLWRKTGQGGMKQGEAVFPVLEPGNRYGSVTVTVRHRDRDAGNPGLGFVDGPGIRPASAWLPELIGDLHGITRLGQPAHQARV